MEDERDGDLRVPLISSLFFILVFAGGILLTFYVFAPSISQPWFPMMAFIFIGSPWVFWLLTYLYTCFKGCCAGRPLIPYNYYSYDHHQVSSRRVASTPPRPHSVVAANNNQTAKQQAMMMSRSRSPVEAASPPKVSCSSNNNNVGGSRHVHFGEVVVVESDGSKVVHEVDSWTNSTKAIQILEPLNAS